MISARGDRLDLASAFLEFEKYTFENALLTNKIWLKDEEVRGGRLNQGQVHFQNLRSTIDTFENTLLTNQIKSN